METGKSTYVTWHIVFTKSELKTFLMGMLDKNFQHVYAMRKSEGGAFWIIVNPLRGYTSVTLESVDTFPHARLYCGRDAVILPIRAKVTANNARHTICVFNCVEVVKSLLGIRSFWIWTPYQLYRRLTHE